MRKIKLISPALLPSRCRQCRTCGRLLLSGFRLGSVVHHFLLASLETQPNRQAVDEFARGFNQHIEWASDWCCAACFHSEYAAKERNAGRAEDAAISEYDCEIARKFYDGAAYRAAERRAKEAVRKDLPKPSLTVPA